MFANLTRRLSNFKSFVKSPPFSAGVAAATGAFTGWAVMGHLRFTRKLNARNAMLDEYKDALDRELLRLERIYNKEILYKNCDNDNR
jgi:hypothetical protein